MADENKRRQRPRKNDKRREKKWPFGTTLRVRAQGPTEAGVAAADAAPAATAAAAVPGSEEAAPRGTVAKHLGVLLLPPLGWFPAAVAGVLKWRPAAVPEPVVSAVAEPVVAAAGLSACGSALQGASVLKCLVRSEAFLAGAILVAAPFLLRLWARAEAEHHDTLECRTVLQTYLIAGFGWVCAVLAAVAGNPVYAVKLQLAWRVVAARSLWTWSDLGRDLTETPGWLHAAVSRWRIFATRFALAGAAARLLVLMAGLIGRGNAVVLALSSPTLDFVPAWLVQGSTVEMYGYNAAQVWLGVSMYAWIGYYVVFFLPYRVLYDEYQSYDRRLAQYLKDMKAGHYDVELATKLGPPSPKHLRKRMARTPPGEEREYLRLLGVIRQRSGGYIVRKVARRVRKKDGTLATKNMPLEFGDMSHWGSDLFERLEQQERLDKKTGRKWELPPIPGSGSYWPRIARILREARVELGKTDAEMRDDPALSLRNLMKFDPDAETGEFDVLEAQASIDMDAARDNYRMRNSHNMVLKAPSPAEQQLREAGIPSSDGAADLLSGADFGVAGESDLGTIRSTDSVYYKSGDTSGTALEEAVLRAQRQASTSSSTTTTVPEKKKRNGKEREKNKSTAAPKMTPATATRQTQEREGRERQGDREREKTVEEPRTTPSTP
eukprot:g19346.t1